ncbi:MAG: radical SAM protein [Candidatus Helarchaeota archaeon]
MHVHCHWYVTTRCNSRCRTCSIWKDPKFKSKESPLASRIALLKQIKKLGFLSIDFTGGEPLLYPELPKLIREAKRLGMMTWLTSNGLLYPKHARELKGNVTQLCFSLDSANPKVHNEIRGIECFDKVIKAIKMARNLGEVPMIKNTVCEENVDELKNLARLAQKLGVLIEFNAEFAYFNNKPLSDDGIKKILKLKRHPNVIVSLPQLQFIKDGGNNPRRPKCPIGQKLIVLAPNNDLYYPCMHLAQRQIPLIDGDLIKTLKDEEVKRIYRNVGRLPICNGCTIPCYMETSYYTDIDKYFFLSYYGRIDYVRKRARLTLVDKLNA